ncbi:hypothetical protein ABIE26_001425 [Pedobacter africanus]|jgi:hypothetical protein|uniref:Uncharacterized protein n=1 Tax=Pedobacter africanus TaxID=151894 RepID=A0ACC6KSL4_9SPHI|nr:hypothetical protein [Pedobacter africanus]
MGLVWELNKGLVYKLVKHKKLKIGENNNDTSKIQQQNQEHCTLL